MVEKIKVNRFWKNIIEFVKENGYFFWEKKVNLIKKKLCFSCGNDKFSVTFIFSTIFKPNEIDFGKISLNLSKKIFIFLEKKKVNLTKFCCVFHVEMTNSLLLSSILPFLSQSK